VENEEKPAEAKKSEFYEGEIPGMAEYIDEQNKLMASVNKLTAAFNAKQDKSEPAAD